MRKKKEKVYKERKPDINVILPGDLSRSPDDFFKAVVFIDNAYLMRVKKYFFSEGLIYSVKDFIETLAKKNKYAVEKIYLYDAPPFQSESPTVGDNLMLSIGNKILTVDDDSQINLNTKKRIVLY